ncbi:MAG: NAD-dependent epimerase/dehydratase family protein [Firmicutes bacterium]|nr:NAD-dependent epimerase/dehydratase family protein [Bacillota bacterium]
MKEKILITGGAGFIGSHLTQSLVNKNYDVTIIDNLSEQIHGDYRKSSLYKKVENISNFIHADIRSKSELTEAVNGCDIIVHLASETGTGQSMYNMEKYVDVNLRGTALLGDILVNDRSRKIKKIILASSRAVYGEGKYSCPDHKYVYPSLRTELNLLKKDFNIKCPFCNRNVSSVPTDEQSQTNPISIYGITKLCQEQILASTASTLKIPISILRFQNVYGPGQSLSNAYTGILSIFSNQILRGKSINIFEDGKESRDFVYIDDVIKSLEYVIEKNISGNNVFNVGSGIATSVIDMANILIKKYKIDVELNISGNFRLGDIRNNFADISKIRKSLDFHPQITLEEGISRFTNWVQGEALTVDNYELSLREMENAGILK